MSTRILKILEASLGFDIGKRNTKKLSEQLKVAPDKLAETVDYLRAAIGFLDDKCGVPSAYMVPYSYQAILLAEALRLDPEPSDDALQLLESWFWLTTIGGSFAGISGYRLTQVADDITTIVKNLHPAWSFTRDFSHNPLPAKVDFNAVRIKGLALRLAARQPSSGKNLLVRYRNQALTQLFPPKSVSKSCDV